MDGVSILAVRDILSDYETVLFGYLKYKTVYVEEEGLRVWGRSVGLLYSKEKHSAGFTIDHLDKGPPELRSPMSRTTELQSVKHLS